MQIDWLTVVAQIVNFLILVYLLKRFLYRPVTNAMARREERIAERVRASQETREAAENERRQLAERESELDRQRESFLEQARAQAEQERRQLLDEARDEAEAARRRWQEQAQDERGQFLADLRRQTAEAFAELARKALGDLAEADLEEQMARAFVERLKGLDDAGRRALGGDDGRLAVASGFELDAGVRRRLTRAIHEHVQSEAEIEYRQSPEVVCGIELIGAGRRFGWTLADYLDALEARLKESLGARESRQEPAPGSAQAPAKA